MAIALTSKGYIDDKKRDIFFIGSIRDSNNIRVQTACKAEEQKNNNSIKENKMVKKLMIILISIFIVLPLFVGCGPSESSIRATAMAEIGGTATAAAAATNAQQQIINAQATAQSIQATAEAQARQVAEQATMIAEQATAAARNTTKWYVEISNVDDEAILYINGVEVTRLTKTQGQANPSSGRIEITAYLHAGSNKLELQLFNTPFFGMGGYSFQIRLYRDASQVWQDSIASALGDDPSGMVASTSYTIEY